VFLVLALVAIALAAVLDGRKCKKGGCGDKCGKPKAARCRGYRWLARPLVSDVLNSAPATDADIVNPWGVAVAPCNWLNGSSSSSSSPAPSRPCGPCAPCGPASSSSSSPVRGERRAWVAVNQTGLLVEYELDDRCELQATRQRSVIVPSATSGNGAPTGVVINDDDGFEIPVPPVPPPTGGTGPTNVTTPARILSATEDGLIVGWSPEADPLNATVMVTSPDAVYKGLALLESKLYVANFHSGQVEVYDNTFAAAGSFTDPALVAIGYAPFNVAAIAGHIYVSFAKQDNTAHDDLPGIGNGYIDVFDAAGTFVKRLINRGNLNSPWAMVCYKQELLVGNFGDGHINRYDRCSGKYLGPLTDCCCKPIVIDGLWGIAAATRCVRVDCGPCRRPRIAEPRCASNVSLLVAAGINSEADGLISILRRASKSRCPC
jgi:uncharacterized protein (TIGR03118 family)